LEILDVNNEYKKQIGKIYWEKQKMVLPKNLKKLECSCLATFPENLEEYNYIGFNKMISFNTFPMNLQKLSLTGNISQLILPTKLKYLSLSYIKIPNIIFPDFLLELEILDYRYELTLPDGLESLKLNKVTKNFNIPINLKKLKISNSSIHKLILPPFIKEVSILTDYNFPIDSFPPNIEFLEFGPSYNHKLPPYPTSLKKLSLSSMYEFPIDNLPNEFEELIIINNYAIDIVNLPESTKILKLVMNHSVLSNPNKCRYIEQYFKKYNKIIQIFQS